MLNLKIQTGCKCICDIAGAQCKAEVHENIVWERTPADITVNVPCPGSMPENTEIICESPRNRISLDKANNIKQICCFSTYVLISRCHVCMGSLMYNSSVFLVAFCCTCNTSPLMT